MYRSSGFSNAHEREDGGGKGGVERRRGGEERERERGRKGDRPHASTLVFFSCGCAHRETVSACRTRRRRWRERERRTSSAVVGANLAARLRFFSSSSSSLRDKGTSQRRVLLDVRYDMKMSVDALLLELRVGSDSRRRLCCGAPGVDLSGTGLGLGRGACDALVALRVGLGRREGLLGLALALVGAERGVERGERLRARRTSEGRANEGQLVGAGGGQGEGRRRTLLSLSSPLASSFLAASTSSPNRSARFFLASALSSPSLGAAASAEGAALPKRAARAARLSSSRRAAASLSASTWACAAAVSSAVGAGAAGASPFAAAVDSVASSPAPAASTAAPLPRASPVWPAERSDSPVAAALASAVPLRPVPSGSSVALAGPVESAVRGASELERRRAISSSFLPVTGRERAARSSCEGQEERQPKSVPTESWRVDAP